MFIEARRLTTNHTLVVHLNPQKWLEFKVVSVVPTADRKRVQIVANSFDGRFAETVDMKESIEVLPYP